MKIGFVLDDTLDSTDGVQQYVLTLGRWLTEKGHEVHYIVGETTRVDIKNIHSITKNIKVTFNKNKLSVPLPADRKKIQRLLETEHFDILHVQVPYSPQMAAKVISAANPKVLIVGTFHILPFSTKEIIATKALSRIVGSTKGRFNTFIAVSEPAKEFAKTAFGIDSEVIPNPVKFQLTGPVNKDTKRVEIVFLGRLVQRKGVLQLLEAFSGLIKECADKNIHLTICGTGPLMYQVQKRIDELDLSKNVSCLGFIKEVQKNEILARADIAVFPSIGGESFGIVLTEAMSAGAGVVLGGDNPGYRSVLQANETLFDPLDTNAFVRCMRNFIDNPKLLGTVHDTQKKLVKEYDIEEVGPRILALYTREIAKIT